MALFALMIAAGCGDTNAGVDAGRDAGRAMDAGDRDDAGIDAGDVDAGDVDAGDVDAGDVDAGDIDAGDVDAGAVDAGVATELGPVACRTSADCGAGQTCDVDAPGGRCMDCAGVDTCGVEFECLFGGCLRPCADDTECNAGMRCAAFAEGSYCRPRTCVTCPGPYVCRDGECSRPLCEGGACPSPLVCSGTVCVEP